MDGTFDQLIATATTRGIFGNFVMDAVHNVVYPGLGGSFQVDGVTNLLENGPVFGNFAPPVNNNCAAISGTGLDFSLHN